MPVLFPSTAFLFTIPFPEIVFKMPFTQKSISPDHNPTQKISGCPKVCDPFMDFLWDIPIVNVVADLLPQGILPLDRSSFHVLSLPSFFHCSVSTFMIASITVCPYRSSQPTLVEFDRFSRSRTTRSCVFAANILHSESTSFTSMGSLVRVQLSPPLGSPCRSRASTFLSPRHHRRGVHFFQGSPRRRERLGPPFRSHGRLAQLPENRGGFVGGINWLCKFIFRFSGASGSRQIHSININMLFHFPDYVPDVLVVCINHNIPRAGRKM